MNLFPRKLSLQLIIPLMIIVMLVGSVAVFVHVKAQEGQLLDAMVAGADQLSGSISSATWHAMLTDQRTSAYEIMQTIAQKQGINRIRIFNKEGRIMFSTVAGDTGQVDKDAEACSMCHSSLQPLVKVDVPSRARVFHAPDGGRKLGIITPIYNEAACSNANCHAHPESMRVLGVLDVSLDLNRVDMEIAAIKWRTLMIAGTVIVLMALFVVLFTRYFVHAPIRKLIEGTRAVSAMELDTPVEIHSSEELGELARSFDAMRVRLKGAVNEINTFTQNLEAKVEERTEQLKLANQKLQHSDRLASLGQLSASVAHEINNPLSGVLNLSMLMERIVKDDGIPPNRIQEFRKYLSQVVQETARAGRIVQDLLAFSRRSRQQRSTVELNAVLRRTVNLVRYKLETMNVAIDMILDPLLPKIDCDASQIQQVVLNLIMNGAEAAQSKGNGKIILTTGVSANGKEIVLEVTDNGDGIPEKNLAKIFDPFFTTKEEGKGVGLGLAVVYGIVEAHSGDIEVKSRTGEGTIFTITLPIEAEQVRKPVENSDSGSNA